MHEYGRTAMEGPHLAGDADAVLAGAFAVLRVRAVGLRDARGVRARLGLLLLGACAGNSAFGWDVDAGQGKRKAITGRMPQET